MMDVKHSLLRSEVEHAEEWRTKWHDEIPALKFNPEWDVRIIPPFGGALVRFVVEYNERFVSVYFDAFEALSIVVGEPYWEIWPNEDEDIERFYMNETDKMMDAINRILNA